ncbi:MAG: restriction endonuclease subunit S [Gallionella sp.]|nr:restriction endonuclease subunit S [Gallionella sp.]
MPEAITDNLGLWTSALLTKSTAGRGSNGKLEAYGIKKLRELILELALRGKLLPQDPSDEPASVLLDKIAKEKTRLIKEGLLKKEKLLADIGDDEKSFEPPSGWEWVRFGTIAQHNSGKTLDSGRNTGQLRDYITTSNLYWGRFDLVNVRQMPIADDELSKCTARKGDLLICEGGESGRAAVWLYDHEVCFQNHVHRARFYGEIDPYFVYRFFEKLNATGEIDQHRKGVGISNMSSKALALIALPLPPFAEQRRIVAKVDELMALCDKLEQQQTHSTEAHKTLVASLLDTLTRVESQQEFSAAWARIASHFDTLFTTEASIDQLKQTILQLAVMGKLVPQDPNDEPASALLKRIQVEKTKLIAEGKIKKDKPLPEITEEEKPLELPQTWAWARIGTSVQSTEYGLSEKTFESSEGVPVLKMGDIQDGKVILGGQKKVAQNVEGLPELYLRSGDLIYNRTNSAELVGKTGIYEGPDGVYTFASYLIRIRCIDGLFSPRYLNFVMSTPLFRETQIEPHLKQQCGQANVNGTIMKNMIVSVPPLAEQHRIVVKVDELMALCDTLKARLAAAQVIQLHLADAIVEQAVC